jgi:protein O-mannosyl-transferase
MRLQTECNPVDPVAPTFFPRILRSPRGETLLLVLFLVLATLLLYEPSLHNAFVNYDDPDYVTGNFYVLHGLSWHNLAWAFTTTAEANWHPLTWISHMADVQIFGLNAAGHHLTNALLHTLNVVLLFLLLKRATGYVERSAIVAALFALCPLNVESVAWIAERKSLLCTTFLLLALFAYGWYVRRPSVARYLVVALLFALGLMAKPMIITLPFCLLLADYWPLQRIGAHGAAAPGTPTFGGNLLKLTVEKIPLFLLSLGSALVTLYAQRAGGALGATSLLPLHLRIKNAVYSYLAYIVKGIWPVHLAVFYPHPENSLRLWKVAGAALVLLVITGVVWHYRERRYLLTGWLWYVVTLVPVIGIVQVGRQGMADRYVYIPFVGLFVIGVWLVADLASHLRLPKSAVIAVALIALSGYAYASHVQIGYWRNSYTLFSHALQVTTGNAIAEDNLGVALVEMGRSDLAMEHFEAAIQLMPQLSTAHYNLATLLHEQNRLDQAMAQYKLALAYTADPVEAARAHNNLGAALSQLGQPAMALSEFSAAIRLNPNENNSFLGRGLIEYQAGNLPAARDDISRAVQIAPSPLSLCWLGRVLEDEGDLKSAANAYEAALRIAPGMSEAQVRLDALRLKAQR